MMLELVMSFLVRAVTLGLSDSWFHPFYPKGKSCHIWIVYRCLFPIGALCYIFLFPFLVPRGSPLVDFVALWALLLVLQ